jgi:hypothetical protein
MYPVLLSGYSRKYCPNNPEYAAGHSSTQTLEKYYAQIYKKNKKIAANKFDKLDDMVRRVGESKIISICA